MFSSGQSWATLGVKMSHWLLVNSVRGSNISILAVIWTAMDETATALQYPICLSAACVDHLTKCSTIVTSPRVIKGCCLWPPVSALLMVLPRTGQLLTVRLLPRDTRISVNAARDASPPTTCTWTTNDDLRLLWRRRATVTAVIGGSSSSDQQRHRRQLVLPSLWSLLVLSYSRSLCRLCMALCSSSDHWERYADGWVNEDRELVRSPHSVNLHAAVFNDCLASIMCLCLVALNCTNGDINIVNQTLQVRRIGYRSAVALSAPMLQITADVRYTTSLSVWHLERVRTADDQRWVSDLWLQEDYSRASSLHPTMQPTVSPHRCQVVSRVILTAQWPTQ